MKKSGFFLLFSFLGLVSYKSSYAQQRIATFTVGISRPYEAYSATDSLGFSAYIFQNNKFYEVNFLDSDFNTQRTAVTEKIKADKNQKIIGAVLDNDLCTVYFYNKKLKTFSLLSVKRSSGESHFAIFYVANQNEQYLSAFEMNEKLYVMLIPRNTDVVKLLALKGSKMEEMNINVSLPGFYHKLSNNNDFMNGTAQSDVGIEKINYQLENSIESSYSRKKLYHYDDKIYLSFDEPYMTHLVIIDPVIQRAYYKKLNFSLEKGNHSSKKQGNSFIYKNKLFRTTISPDQLNISILDLDSMSLVNAYNFFPKEDINILNGPIMQKDGSASSYTSDNKTLQRTAEFFDRTLNGNIVIAANEIDSNKYELRLGSYEFYSVNSGPMYAGFGAPGLSTGMGPAVGIGIGRGSLGNIYNSGYPGYYSNQTTTRLRITYFKSILDNKDFSHLKGTVPKNLRERISEYEAKISKHESTPIMIVSTYKNNFHLGYYTPSTKRFNIVEFRK